MFDKRGIYKKAFEEKRKKNKEFETINNKNKSKTKPKFRRIRTAIQRRRKTNRYNSLNKNVISKSKIENPNIKILDDSNNYTDEDSQIDFNEVQINDITEIENQP